MIYPSFSESANVQEPLQPANPTLLIVDDDLSTLSGMELFFSVQYDTVTCDNSESALAVAQQGHVDLILLDVNMPGMNGHELCATLQQRATTKNIPVIILTGSIDDNTEFNSLNAGAVDFMPKPVDLQTLRLKVENHMKLARHRRELSEMSYTDALTGVANRRYIEKILRRECQAAVRTEQPLSLAIIDIDNFKDYNDTLGHQKGDQCLAQVAQTLKGTLRRENDLIGRFGGEEFMVILPNTDLAGAEGIVHQMLTKLREVAVLHPASDCSNLVSVSVGIASYSPDLLSDDELNADALFAQADDKLYQAKQNGKDCYCC